MDDNPFLKYAPPKDDNPFLKYAPAPAEKQPTPQPELKPSDYTVLPGGEFAFNDPQKQKEYEAGKADVLKSAAVDIPKGMFEGAAGLAGDIRGSLRSADTGIKSGLGKVASYLAPADRQDEIQSSIQKILTPFGVLATGAEKLPLPSTPFIQKRLTGEVDPNNNIQKIMRETGAMLGVPGAGKLLDAGAGAAKAVSKLGAGAVRASDEILGKLTGKTAAMAEAEELRTGLGEKAAGKSSAQSSAAAQAELSESVEAAAAKHYETQKAALEKIKSDADAVTQTKLRQEAGLAEPEGRAQIAAQQHVEAKLRGLAVEKKIGAKEEQRTVGGGAFENYEKVATKKQAAQPFGASPQGNALSKQLDDIIEGGPRGGLQKYSKSEMALAKKLKNEFFLRPDGAHVDYKVVDSELRKLRDIQYDTKNESYSAEERRRIKSFADKIEKSLKEWVGESNYPREAYAEASEKLNRFRSDFAKALTDQKEIKYLDEEGGFAKTESQAAKLVFRDRTNMRLAKQILGDNEVNALAEQHAVNSIGGMDAKKVRAWLNNKNNEFIDEVPGLPEKLEKYAQSLERRDALIESAKAGIKTQAQAAKERAEAVESLSKQKEKAEGLSRAFHILGTNLTTGDPRKALPVAKGFIEKAFDSKVIDKSEYDRINKAIEAVDQKFGKSDAAMKHIYRIIQIAAATWLVKEAGELGINQIRTFHF